MSTPKRAKDRESGTGAPIKPIAPKGGSGKGNWGSDQEQINQAMEAQNTETAANDNDRRRKRGQKEPDNFAALNPEEATKAQQSWDEYQKAKNKKKTEAYNRTTVKSDFKKKYKPNKFEAETDALFGGENKKKKKNQKKKKKKVLLQTQVFYSDRGDSGGGRGRGRGRGRGYDNMRGGGYQRGGGRGGYGGGRGGYGGGRGGGYGGGYDNRRRGGGFGSRGRGSFNNEYDNSQNFQNQNQYQPNESSSNQANENQNNAPQQNQDNVNIPVSVQ